MELKLKKVNVSLFKEFLTKLSSFNKYAYLKLDNDKLSSKTYLQNRDAVKMVEMSTQDIFEFEGKLKAPLKITFYNANYIIKMLEFFQTDTVQGVIDYTETSSGLSAEKFVVKNSQEKFDLYCADPKFAFIDMTAEEISTTFATKELNDEDGDSVYFASFDLRYDMIEKLKKRLSINSRDEEKFTIKIANGLVYSITKNNELLISDEPKIESDKATEVTLFKKYLNLLDKESYKLHLCTNKIVFESLISDTKLAISTSIKNEDMEDVTDLNNNEDFDGMDIEFNDEIAE